MAVLYQIPYAREHHCDLSTLPPSHGLHFLCCRQTICDNMAPSPLGQISPPLVNSSNPWATTLEDLDQLYKCSSTGAVTTRTSLIDGFTQHPSTHQYTFFSTSTGYATAKIDVAGAEGRGEVVETESSSLNTLGYSPHKFQQYVQWIAQMSNKGELDRTPEKPFIVSVTGTPSEIGEAYEYLIKLQRDPILMFSNSDSKGFTGLKVMMEINLSCPNIPDKPPPAYDGESLNEYIVELSKVLTSMNLSPIIVPVGIKTPPYTYHAQFQTLIDCLESSVPLHPSGCPISFITATNTLGSCFVFNPQQDGAALGSVGGSGVGGMGGEAIHGLALGNVKMLRNMLDSSKHSSVKEIGIIGVGGVGDADGFERMRKVGADVVGIGTAFGRGGIQVFDKILQGR